MLEIKMYGLKTQYYLELREKIIEFLREVDEEYQLEEIEDINEMVNENIHSIPAISINNGLTRSVYGKDELTKLENILTEAVSMEKSQHLKKILVPIDYSDTSINALKYASDLSNKWNAEIKLVHVFMPPVDPNYGAIGGASDLQEMQKMKCDQLDKIIANTVSNRETVKSECLVGFPVETLIRESVDYDLIILGSTGEKTGLEKLFGSVSSAVARKAKCPVLLVPQNVSFAPFKHVAYAFNSDSDDSFLLSLSRNFADQFGAVIHLVHVLEKGEKQNQDTNELMSEYFSSNEILFDFVYADDVSKGLNKYVNSKGIDLMILVSKHRNFWVNLVHTSFTKRVALSTKIPLMVYHK